MMILPYIYGHEGSGFLLWFGLMFLCGYNKKRELPYIYGQEGRGFLLWFGLMFVCGYNKKRELSLFTDKREEGFGFVMIFTVFVFIIKGSPFFI